MSSSRPTIRSVAERANVAISTVSRVVNGGRASSEVSQRVQRAVEDLGYRPSVMAQSLVTRRAGCLGLAVNSCKSTWFSQVLVGVEEALQPSRNSLLLASLMQRGRYDPSVVLGWIEDRRVDGVMLVRTSSRDEVILESAQRASLPIVLIAPDTDEFPNTAVRCDNLEAGRLAAAHLIDIGHRKFAFAGGPEQSVDTRLRLNGFLEGLRAHGLNVTASDISFGRSYGRAAGQRYAEQFLSLPFSARPTAVVLGNDAMALSFMRTLLVAGVRIPDEVSVVGFDGTPEGAQFWPGLTTVEQPTEEMATRACEALIHSIRTPDTACSAAFGVKLLLRESTAPPPTA